MINVRINDGPTKLTPRITVVGVGGGGSNAVNNMIRSGLEGCEFLTCNTDAQSLQQSLADHQLQLGAAVTSGLGAGARPDVGRAAAEESLEDIINYLDGANMVFIACGMGGGTGTGAAPVIARAARDHGILTVGVATKPFHFEGANRMKIAEAGLKELQDYVDTLIVIPNQNLFRIANEKTTFADAFSMADDVLQSGVRGVTDLMVMPGLINLDFADIKSVMAEMGKAMMGTGESSGERRALEAAESAISNPLLDDVSMKGAKGVLINITGGMDMTLFEVDEAANRIRDEVDPDANIIFGSTFDEAMEGSMRVSVVATGIDYIAGRKGTPDTTAVHPMSKGTTFKKEATMATATPPQPQKTAVVQETAATVAVEEQTVAQDQTVEEQVADQKVVNQGIVTPYGHHIPPAGTPVTTAPQVKVVAGTAQTPQPTPATPQKAETVDGHFIPPEPVTAETVETSSAPTPAPEPATTVSPEPATTVTKPAVSQADAEQKRSPTLFERLKDGIASRHKEEEIEKVEPSLGEAQKTLGIDPETKGEDDLDIPAFLRRQSS